MAKLQEIYIAPGKGVGGYWKEVIAYRSLFYFLVWRDILIRYKQTVLGVAWVFARPLVSMLALTIIFEYLAHLPSDGGVPYPLMILCALLPWQLFAGAMTDCGNSLVGNAALVSKIYFPRIIIPTSAVIASLLDFVVAMLPLACMLAWYGRMPTYRFLLLPLFVLMALLLAWGVGIWVAALNVKYRDFRFLVPYGLQFGLLLSPVGFSSSVVPDSWQLIYALNPLVGIIDGFRWALLGSAMPLSWSACASTVFWIAVLTIGGFLFFRRSERQFADII